MTHEPLVTITLAEYNRLIGTGFSTPTVIGLSPRVGFIPTRTTITSTTPSD